MLETVKFYLDEVQNYKLLLRMIPWHDYDMLVDLNPEYRFVNLDQNIAFESIINVVNELEIYIEEVILIQYEYGYDFHNFKYENFVFLKDKKLAVFNIEILQRITLPVRKIIVSQIWTGSDKFQNFKKYANFIETNVSLNIMFIPEVSNFDDLEIVKNMDFSNTIFIGQKIYFKNAKNLEYHHWMLDTYFVNYFVPFFNDNLQKIEAGDKELLFDCLFGTENYHRELFYHKLDVDNQTVWNCFVTTRYWTNNTKHNCFVIQDDLAKLINIYNHNDLEYQHNKKIDNMVDVHFDSIMKSFFINDIDKALCDNFKFIRVLDKINFIIAEIVPFDVYSKTAYSIVFESMCHTPDEFLQYNLPMTYFLTEKITKPILAKRLFLVYGTPGVLQYIKSLGFKTFDSIIDENYDNIECYGARADEIIKQMKRLECMNQDDIRARIQPIVEHNYKTLQNLFEENFQLFRYWF